MSVYVGIDVHRKRSQVAVVTEDGTVQLNKNVVNGTEPLTWLIRDLPAGTPVAFEAAFGWGWLVQLLEEYGFAPHLAHPLRCKAIELGVVTFACRRGTGQWLYRCDAAWCRHSWRR